MKCKKCNTENNYYHKFCYYCGNSFNINTEVNKLENTEITSKTIVFNSTNHLVDELKKKRKRKVIKSLVIITGFIVALVLGYNILFNIIIR